MNITEFLLARIAEDETAVSGHDFSYVEWDTGVPKCRHPEHVVGYSASCWKAVISARALRQCAAYRRIVERHSQIETATIQDHGGQDEVTYCGHCGTDLDEGDCPDLLDLTSIWSDHPDRQEGWSA